MNKTKNIVQKKLANLPFATRTFYVLDDYWCCGDWGVDKCLPPGDEDKARDYCKYFVMVDKVDEVTCNCPVPCDNESDFHKHPKNINFFGKNHRVLYINPEDPENTKEIIVDINPIHVYIPTWLTDREVISDYIQDKFESSRKGDFLSIDQSYCMEDDEYY
jgi:hypothetical protein